MTTVVCRMKPKAMTRAELRERIDLTENERWIFDLLIGALRESNHQTQLRVAGGWVRDKAISWNS